jgi:hypothetical protein
MSRLRRQVGGTATRPGVGNPPQRRCVPAQRPRRACSRLSLAASLQGWSSASSRTQVVAADPVKAQWAKAARTLLIDTISRSVRPPASRSRRRAGLNYCAPGRKRSSCRAAARPILHVELDLGSGRRLHVINVHLKSKIPTPDPRADDRQLHVAGRRRLGRGCVHLIDETHGSGAGGPPRRSSRAVATRSPRIPAGGWRDTAGPASWRSIGSPPAGRARCRAPRPLRCRGGRAIPRTAATRAGGR